MVSVGLLLLNPLNDHPQFFNVLLDGCVARFQSLPVLGSYCSHLTNLVLALAN